MPLIVINTVAPTVVPLVNGNFEAGSLTGWTAQRTNIEPLPTISTAQVHSGTYSALIGESSLLSVFGRSFLSQVVALPAGPSTLSFYWYPVSNTLDTNRQLAQVRSADGVTLLATIFSLQIDLLAPSWRRVQFDLTPWAGTSIMLRFEVNAPGSTTGLYFYLDDVTITQPLELAAATPGPRPRLLQNPTNVTGAMRSNSGADWAALEAQRAANPTTIFYQWRGEPPTYSTGTLDIAYSVANDGTVT